MKPTGQRDSAGKEIMEGNTLKSFDGEDARICEVYFNTNKNEFYVKHEPHDFDSPLWMFLKFSQKTCLIVGLD